MLDAMSVAGARPDLPGLAGLPGSGQDPGEGPAEPSLLDALLDDGALDRTGLPAALAAHRDLVGGDLRDLVATLVVPARLAAELPGALTAADLGTRILLTESAADPLAALEELDAARWALWDEDRLELVGRRLRLPARSGDPTAATAALLPLLAAAVPTWLTLPPQPPGPGDALGGILDVLAADGAEHVALDVSNGEPLALAVALRSLVDRDLTFRAAGAAGVHHGRPNAAAPEAPRGAGAPGVLNVLCAVRAALNGAEPEELARVLAATDAAPLVSAVRRMSAADGAVVRAFLVAVEVPDAAAAAADLRQLGLVEGELP